jgi:hypothetical protein
MSTIGEPNKLFESIEVGIGWFDIVIMRSIVIPIIRRIYFEDERCSEKQIV